MLSDPQRRRRLRFMTESRPAGFAFVVSNPSCLMVSIRGGPHCGSGDPRGLSDIQAR